jgi:hypothetical protein
MEKVFIIMLMEIFIKDNSQKVQNTAKDSTNTLIVIYIKDNITKI